MKTSTLALLTSAAMALSIPNHQNGQDGNMERKNELQFNKAMNPTPSTGIEESFRSSSISGNWDVVIPEDSEVVFFPRHSQESDPNVPETAQSDDDSDLILIPRDSAEAQESEEPRKPQASEHLNDSNSDSVSPDTRINGEIKEKVIALEAEVSSMAQKVQDEKKLDVLRYFAVHSEIIDLRETFRSRPADMQTRREMEGVISQALDEYRNLNKKIGNVCDGKYDPYGYCSTFSADTFFDIARANSITFDFLLGEFEDDRYIKDPEHFERYVPKLVFTYNKAVETFNELGKFGLNRWLNGDKRRAVAEYFAVKEQLEKVTAVMQKYKLV